MNIQSLYFFLQKIFNKIMGWINFLECYSNDYTMDEYQFLMNGINHWNIFYKYRIKWKAWLKVIKYSKDLLEIRNKVLTSLFWPLMQIILTFETLKMFITTDVDFSVLDNNKRLSMSVGNHQQKVLSWKE